MPPWHLAPRLLKPRVRRRHFGGEGAHACHHHDEAHADLRRKIPSATPRALPRDPSGTSPSHGRSLHEASHCQDPKDSLIEAHRECACFNCHNSGRCSRYLRVFCDTRVISTTDQRPAICWELQIQKAQAVAEAGRVVRWNYNQQPRFSLQLVYLLHNGIC